jgi:hypothetical protein
MSVLEATPPSFGADDVARIAAELFGLDSTATDLGSERDQTFLVEGPSGSGVRAGTDEPGLTELRYKATLGWGPMLQASAR